MRISFNLNFIQLGIYVVQSGNLPHPPRTKKSATLGNKLQYLLQNLIYDFSTVSENINHHISES